MPSKKQIVFIINPASGVNKKSNLGDKIIGFFEGEMIEPIIKYTQKAGDAYDFAKQYAEKSFDSIVVAGGDGTINEVVNGIGTMGVPLGIIPGGSGNGLARHLGIPLNSTKALKVILDGIIQDIDVLDINGKLSANVSGVGFDALVAHRFQNKSKRGLSSYIKVILKEFNSFQAQNYKLIIDGKECEKEAFLISFANSSQFGNNASISPKASISDGLFDLCIVKPFPKISTPIILQRLMTGRIDKDKHLEIIKAKELTLTQESDIYHLDGDPFEGGRRLNIKILPSVLKIIIPKKKLNKI